MTNITFKPTIERLHRDVTLEERLISDHLLILMLPDILDGIKSTMGGEIGDVAKTEAAELQLYDDEGELAQLAHFDIQEQVNDGKTALDLFRVETPPFYAEDKTPILIPDSLTYWSTLLELTEQFYTHISRFKKPKHEQWLMKKAYEDSRDSDSGFKSVLERRNLDLTIRHGNLRFQRGRDFVYMDVERMKYWDRFLGKMTFRVVKAIKEYKAWNTKWEKEYLKNMGKRNYAGWLGANKKHLLDDETVGRIGKPPEDIDPLEYVLQRATVYDLVGRKMVVVPQKDVSNLKQNVLNLNSFKPETAQLWNYEKRRMGEPHQYFDNHYQLKHDGRFRPGVCYTLLVPNEDIAQTYFGESPEPENPRLPVIDLGLVDLRSFIIGELGEHSHAKHEQRIRKSIQGWRNECRTLYTLHNTLFAVGYDFLHGGDERSLIGEALEQERLEKLSRD